MDKGVIEVVDVGSLVLDPVNARRHSEKNLKAIKGSLAKFGQQKPIVISADNVVLAGNGTLQAAQKLKWKKIQVIRSKLSGIEAAAYAIADNRAGELAEWDEDLLAKTLASLNAENFDLTFLSFDENGVDLGLDDKKKDKPPRDVRVQHGDTWQIGYHKLICGDQNLGECDAIIAKWEKATGKEAALSQGVKQGV